MASNRYHFEDHWDVPFPIDQVWDVDKVDEPRVGARVAAVARGWKPVFRWNHNWTMVRGQRQILEFMSKRNKSAK
jgi:hypothetical protein